MIPAPGSGTGESTINSLESQLGEFVTPRVVAGPIGLDISKSNVWPGMIPSDALVAVKLSSDGESGSLSLGLPRP